MSTNFEAMYDQLVLKGAIQPAPLELSDEAVGEIITKLYASALTLCHAGVSLDAMLQEFHANAMGNVREDTTEDPHA